MGNGSIQIWDFLGLRQEDASDLPCNYASMSSFSNPEGNFACSEETSNFQLKVDVNPSLIFEDATQEFFSGFYSTQPDLLFNRITGMGIQLKTTDATPEMIDAFRDPKKTDLKFYNCVSDQLRAQYSHLDLNYICSIFYPLTIPDKYPMVIEDYTSLLIQSAKRSSVYDHDEITVLNFLMAWFQELTAKQHTPLNSAILGRISFTLTFLNIAGFEEPLKNVVTGRLYREWCLITPYSDTKASTENDLTLYGDRDLYFGIMTSEYYDNIAWKLGNVEITNDKENKIAALKYLDCLKKNIKADASIVEFMIGSSIDPLTIPDDDLQLLWQNDEIDKSMFFYQKETTTNQHFLFSVSAAQRQKFFLDLVQKNDRQPISNLITYKIVSEEILVDAFQNRLEDFAYYIYPYSIYTKEDLLFYRAVMQKIAPSEMSRIDQMVFCSFAYSYAAHIFETTIDSNNQSIAEIFEKVMELPNPFKQTAVLNFEEIDAYSKSISSKYLSYQQSSPLYRFSSKSDSSQFSGVHFDADQLFPYLFDIARASEQVDQKALEIAIQRLNQDILIPNGYLFFLEKIPNSPIQDFNYFILPAKIIKTEYLGLDEGNVPIYTVLDAKSEMPLTQKYLKETLFIDDNKGIMRSEIFFEEAKKPLWIILSENRAIKESMLYQKLVSSTHQNTKTAFPNLLSTQPLLPIQQTIENTKQATLAHETNHIDARRNKYPQGEVYSVLSEFAQAQDPIQPFIKYAIKFLYRAQDGTLHLKSGTDQFGKAYDSGNDEYGMGFIWFLAYASIALKCMSPNESLLEIARTNPVRFTEIINALDLALANLSIDQFRQLGAGARDSYTQMYNNDELF